MVTWGSQGHGLQELPSGRLPRQGQESRLRLAREGEHGASPPSPPISYQSPKGQGPGKPASSQQPCDAEPSGGSGASESKGPAPGQDWGPGERISPASSPGQPSRGSRGTAGPAPEAASPRDSNWKLCDLQLYTGGWDGSNSTLRLQSTYSLCWGRHVDPRHQSPQHTLHGGGAGADPSP